MSALIFFEQNNETDHQNCYLLLYRGPVKIYAQNYLQARLSEVNRQ